LCLAYVFIVVYLQRFFARLFFFVTFCYNCKVSACQTDAMSGTFME
jgi:hypothetical protein